MSLGLITRTGRVLTAQLLIGAATEGITHCALGDGDATFTDPLNPPDPSVEQTGLKHELIRKRFHRRTYLVEDAAGPLVIGETRYAETTTPTDTVAVVFRFEEAEANGITIREYGFFGGDVAYVSGISSDVARNGVHDASTNPTGEVLRSGLLYEVKHIPDFTKTSDTRIELIGIITA